MNRHQVIVIVVALVAIALLYTLPRVVVDNDKLIQEEGLDAGAEVNGENQAGGIRMKLSSEDSLDVDKFTKLIINGLSENNASFADSLTRIYIKYRYFDRGAELAERLITVDKKRAGTLFYELMARSSEVKKTNVYAEKARSLLSSYAEKGDLDAKAKVAMTYVSTPNPMQGIMMLREVIAEDSNHVDAIYNLGILSVQSGQYDKAIARFEKLINIAPDHIMASVHLGISYFEKGRFEEAKRVFTKLSTAEDENILQIVDEYLQKLN